MEYRPLGRTDMKVNRTKGSLRLTPGSEGGLNRAQRSLSNNGLRSELGSPQLVAKRRLYRQGPRAAHRLPTTGRDSFPPGRITRSTA
jgi:hypothetical protein